MKGEKMEELLIDVLLKINPDVVVHIGSKSSFFCICSAQELIRNIDDISEKVHSDWKESYEKHRRNLERTLQNMPEFSESGIKEYESLMDSWTNKVMIQIQSLKIDEANIKEFIPLKERKVKDTYERMSQDGICVILEGNEIGKYWSIDEVPRSKK